MCSQVSGFLRDIRGAAAAEFVLCLPLVTVPTIGMVDLGIFAVQRMQVDAASQSGVAAAWRVCADRTKPANQTNCTAAGGNLATAITTAVQSTTLGTGATVASTPTVGYYCATKSGALVLADPGTTPWLISATTTPAKPANCALAVSGSTTSPAQYIKVTVNFTYTPVFGVLRAAGVLPSTITTTSWRRLA